MSTPTATAGNGAPKAPPASDVAPRALLPHEAFKDRIPVKTLWANAGQNFDLPGRLSSGSLSTAALDQRHRDHHIIEWVPAMRHHVVVFHQLSQKTTHIRYIPEANVRQWDPA